LLHKASGGRVSPADPTDNAYPSGVFAAAGVLLSWAALTGDGRDLASALRLLADWGSRRSGGEPLRHERCGTPVEARWFCPTCGIAVTDAEISVGAEGTRLV